MGLYNVHPDLVGILKDIKARLQAQENRNRISVYTLATRPATGLGLGVIQVTDAASGSRFQAWDQTAATWAPLG